MSSLFLVMLPPSRGALTLARLTISAAVLPVTHFASSYIIFVFSLYSAPRTHLDHLDLDATDASVWEPDRWTAREGDNGTSKDAGMSSRVHGCEWEQRGERGCYAIPNDIEEFEDSESLTISACGIIWHRAGSRLTKVVYRDSRIYFGLWGPAAVSFATAGFQVAGRWGYARMNPKRRRPDKGRPRSPWLTHKQQAALILVLRILGVPDVELFVVRTFG
ncbi:hypothetical protein B0H16DRAFT_1460469 [Mycena metata]|uniref:Uncharacterized protein n=1 Tax=Mycena metata TaxID=1033252 RepID=A0AAD7N9P1_9AGAR|nr:hypothetical protein B0H16DRAFT_1460469 [Mycena metata]